MSPLILCDITQLSEFVSSFRTFLFGLQAEAVGFFELKRIFSDFKEEERADKNFSQKLSWEIFQRHAKSKRNRPTKFRAFKDLKHKN